MNRDEYLSLLRRDLENGITVTTRDFRAVFSLDSLEEVSENRLPPMVWQRDPRWSYIRYAAGSTNTMGAYGCLICCVYSLAVWAGCGDSLLTFAEELDREGAFTGGILCNQARVNSVYTGLGWPKGAWLPGGEGSFITWRTRPADLQVLRYVLDQYPCVVEVDHSPSTRKHNQHFVLAVDYQPDAWEEGRNDDLLVMDPWGGVYTSVLRYFNPKWLTDGSMAPGVTKVQRTLTGARAWKVL